jgi:hypothetical protein
MPAARQPSIQRWNSPLSLYSMISTSGSAERGLRRPKVAGGFLEGPGQSGNERFTAEAFAFHLKMTPSSQDMS